MKEKIIEIIQQHIDSVKHDYKYDPNVYFDKFSEYAFKDKCKSIIEELEDLKSEVEKLGE